MGTAVKRVRVVMLGVVNIVAGADSQLDDAGEGPCARCGAPHGRVPVAGVVSRVFTGTDSWTQPAGHLLCRACAWAYSAPRAREAIRHVFRAPAAVRELTIAQAYGELSRGGLEASASMVVPIRPGRRHLLPHAQWGRIATDHGCFAWSDADAEATLADDFARGWWSTDERWSAHRVDANHPLDRVVATIATLVAGRAGR